MTDDDAAGCKGGNQTRVKVRQSEATVVVLNWNSAPDTLACLQSVRESLVPCLTVVVDNGSHDASADLIEQSGLADVVLRNDANLGFAEGNNCGLRYALAQGPDMVVVLNNDTVVEPGAIGGLLYALSLRPDAAVSPDIVYFDDPDRPWFRGGVVEHGWPRHLQPDEVQESTAVGELLVSSTPFLSGCCIAAHRSTWVSVGLFDPRYFLIFEDSDWSFRAAQQNVPMLIVHGSSVAHRVSRTMRSGPPALLASYYFTRNALVFQSSYFPHERRRFVWTWVGRPALSMARRREATVLAFRLMGLLAFVFGQHGRAPRPLERLARWVTPRTEVGGAA